MTIEEKIAADAEVQYLRAQLAAVTADLELMRALAALRLEERTDSDRRVDEIDDECERVLAAARLLRESLADMVNQHGGAETCLSSNEAAVVTLAETAWLDAGEGEP